MITDQEYWAEINAIVESIAEEYTPETQEDAHNALWEVIDGHQWVIYTSHNFEVLARSHNAAYAVENWGIESAIKDGEMHWAGLAFGALYGDVIESSAWDQLMEGLD